MGKAKTAPAPEDGTPLMPEQREQRLRSLFAPQIPWQERARLLRQVLEVDVPMELKGVDTITALELAIAASGEGEMFRFDEGAREGIKISPQLVLSGSLCPRPLRWDTPDDPQILENCIHRRTRFKDYPYYSVYLVE